MTPIRIRTTPRWDPPVLCQICFKEFTRPPELEPWVPATKCPDCYPPLEHLVEQIEAEVQLAVEFARTDERKHQRNWDKTEQILHPALADVEKPIVRQPGERGWAEEECKR